jgi:hypothetical protein
MTTVSEQKRTSGDMSSADADVARLERQYACGPVEFAGTPNSFYERRLVFDHILKPGVAGLRERFEAVARSVRDVLTQRWILKDETYERANPKRILRCGSGQCLRSGGTRAMLAYQKEERPPRQMASKHRPGTGCGGAHRTLWVTCAAEASTVTGCEVS